MAKKAIHEELEQRGKELEKEAVEGKPNTLKSQAVGPEGRPK